MSSAINSINFELETRPFSTASSLAEKSSQTTTSANRVAQHRIPTSADVQAINLVNRTYDTFVTILATFMMLGIIASLISLTGWCLYSVGCELSGWNLQDFVHAIQGHRFN